MRRLMTLWAVLYSSLTLAQAGLVKKETGVQGELDEYINIEQFVDIINLINAGELSSRGAKDMITLLWKADTEVRNKKAKDIAEEKGLIIKADPEFLNTIIKQVIENNPTQVEGYKAGKEPLLMYLVGQVMKEGKGAINPAAAQEALKAALK